MPNFTKRHKTKQPKYLSKSIKSLYNSREWQRLSRQFLDENYICSECPSVSEHCDHIKPHGGNPKLFWDVRNWQALCASCHGKKTRKEVFGKD